MNECFYDLGLLQSMLFVSFVGLNNNVCVLGGGVNNNFWFGIFFL